MINKIDKIVKDCFEKEDLPFLTCNEVAFGYSYKINSSVLLRIYTNMKSVYRLEFLSKDKIKDQFPDDVNVAVKGNIFQIDVDKKESCLLDALNKLKETITIQSKILLDSVRVDVFGCCGHYVECSDAKRCIQADVDKKFYKGCQYRKNLEAGRIFYGKNKNI